MALFLKGKVGYPCRNHDDYITYPYMMIKP